jgi:hypothetical protein
MALAAAATGRYAVFVCSAFLVALIWVGTLIRDATPRRAFKAIIARVILSLQPVQTDRRLCARVVAAAECALFALFVYVAEYLICLLLAAFMQ